MPHRHACQTHLPLHPAFNVGSTRIIDESSSFVCRGPFFRTTRQEVSGHEAVWKMFGRRAHRSRHASLNIEGGVQGALFSHSPVERLDGLYRCELQCKSWQTLAEALEDVLANVVKYVKDLADVSF